GAVRGNSIRAQCDAVPEAARLMLARFLAHHWPLAERATPDGHAPHRSAPEHDAVDGKRQSMSSTRHGRADAQPTNSEPIIEVKGLTRKFGDRVAVNDVTFSI